MIEFITDREIYTEVILSRVLKANSFIWIATSDIKDMHINEGKKVVPFLKTISDLIEEGVNVRLIHAKEPGPNFRKDFDRYPNLRCSLERVLCPRSHFKSIIVDGNFAYTGSANLTGAGLGAKSVDKRNFEAGIITTEKKLIIPIMNQFDELWMGKFCDSCKRKEFCTGIMD